MQFVARNVAKVELDSTSATVARNHAGKVVPCVRALNCLYLLPSFRVPRAPQKCLFCGRGTRGREKGLFFFPSRTSLVAKRLLYRITYRLPVTRQVINHEYHNDHA